MDIVKDVKNDKSMMLVCKIKMITETNAKNVKAQCAFHILH
ncbi:MAG: hypothetical protein ACTSO4_12230 [Promethearchaeota archaeon]